MHFVFKFVRRLIIRYGWNSVSSWVVVYKIIRYTFFRRHNIHSFITTILSWLLYCGIKERFIKHIWLFQKRKKMFFVFFFLYIYKKLYRMCVLVAYIKYKCVFYTHRIHYLIFKMCRYCSKFWIDQLFMICILPPNHTYIVDVDILIKWKLLFL